MNYHLIATMGLSHPNGTVNRVNLLLLALWITYGTSTFCRYWILLSTVVGNIVGCWGFGILFSDELYRKPSTSILQKCQRRTIWPMVVLRFFMILLVRFRSWLPALAEPLAVRDRSGLISGSFYKPGNQLRQVANKLGHAVSALLASYQLNKLKISAVATKRKVVVLFTLLRWHSTANEDSDSRCCYSRLVDCCVFFHYY